MYSKYYISSNIMEYEGCWLWLKNKPDSKGYCNLLHKGRNIKVHRYSYLAFFGEIPNGLHVLHKCDRRRCVNPEHLFLGTNLDNVIDRVNKRRSNRPIGERNGNSILTVDDVKEIKRFLAMGIFQKTIAKWFNVHPTTISTISRGDNWLCVI